MLVHFKVITLYSQAIFSCHDFLRTHQLVNAVPENNFENLVTVLQEHHDRLFGRDRAIGTRHWSSYWIETWLRAFTGSRIKTFYQGVKRFKTRNELGVDLSLSYFHVLFKEYDDSIIRDRLKMFLLTGDLNASPQGQEHFSNFIEEAEYWRKNIAIFRSSLV